MIGQEKLLERIEKQISDNTFPHFCILVGAKGSGKKTLAHMIYQMFGEGVLTNFGISVNEVRQAISQSYNISGKQFILFADADRMSLPAKNALLKVTEEAPNDTYFIITLEDINNTLDTIRSRAIIYVLQNYSRDDIDSYYLQKVEEPRKYEREIILSLCETMGEVNTLLNIDAVEFFEYVSYVVDNIAETSGSNSFKIADKLSLKADSEGYDLKMFLKTFMFICIRRMEAGQLSCFNRTTGNVLVSENHIHENPIKYLNGEAITSTYLRELNITGINKQMLFDSWLLAIRDNWMS